MSLQYALLGLIRSEPMNGYTIKTLFDEAIHFVWQANLSQIYRELGAMEKKGLVESSLEHQEDRPNKRVYSITRAGRKAFDEWINAVPEEFAMPKRDEFTLRLFFGSATNEDVVKRHFERFIIQMRKMSKGFRDPTNIAARHPDDPLMARADQACRDDRYCRFIRKRALMTSELVLHWAEECMREMKEGEKS